MTYGLIPGKASPSNRTQSNSNIVSRGHVALRGSILPPLAPRFNLAFGLLCLLLFFVGSAYAEVPNAVPPKGDFDGKHVEQPIEFPHDIHARDNKINCMYCHTYARRGNVAGIPPTSKCMGCHTVIATDKPRIKKLTEYWEKGESPKWKKVYDLPDFVHFNHEKHLKRFIFDNEGMEVERADEVCSFCHGDLKEMTVARKVKSLTMGFCRECHEANDGPFDCWKCHK